MISRGEGSKKLLLLCLLAAACDLPPLDVEGLRCDEARPCGDGYQCIDAVCIADENVIEDAGTDAGRDAGVDAGVDAGRDAGTPDAGTPDAGLPRGVNLLTNPSFESLTTDGGITAWRASTGRLLPIDAGHSGARAGRLQSTAFQQQPVLLPTADVAGAELGMLFCGSLWIRSDTDAGVDLTLTIRDRFFDGGTATSSGTRITVRDNWVQVKEEYASIGVSTIQLRLTANSRFDGGDGVTVDDAWLSRADVGGCP